MTEGKRNVEQWIDWGRMNPLVDPKSIDSVARAQIVAQQTNPNTNRPIEER
jgi:hypothetical protein